MIDDFKQAWDYIYGEKSHMTLLGKIVIGIPWFPIIALIVLTVVLSLRLFVKQDSMK